MAVLNNPRQEAISINLAAEILGVHHMTVRRWIRKGWLKAYKVGPFVIRIPRSEILRMRTLRVKAHQYGDRPEYPQV